tara:strand:+ start:764 stop:2611 length:1848 start_codon:yes stop_codon:yes gene_type:complete
MTISTTTIKNSYSGDGSATSFNYTFKVTDQDDIDVIIRSSDGTETTKTISTHYTVSGVGNASGGSVVFTTGNVPANGETVVLRRDTPQTQGVDLIENDPLPANTLEDALDKATSISQELQEQVDRSLKISRTNTMTSTEFTTSSTDRANKVLSFDSSGELAVTQELGTFKGDWAASTTYAVRDIVKDTSTNNIFIALTAHTSSGSQPLTTNTDSAKWSLIVDAATATTQATNAASSATAAASSATTATTKASEASTSATNAASSATASASSATSASSSASTATTKASEASTSATNAASSATAAATSATQAAAAANFEVLNDTTPQLGGNLDTNEKEINTVSNRNILLAPNGTGMVEVKGNTNAGTIQLNCENNSHGVKIKGPPHSAGQSYTLTLPSSITNNYYLKTDSSGNLSFAEVPTETKPTVADVSQTIAPATATTVTITGTNFVSIPIVQFINASTGAITSANTVSFSSATSLSVNVTLASGNYFVRIENPDGNSGRSTNNIFTASTAPSFSTGAGSLGTYAGNFSGTLFTISASSDSTITFAETTSVLSGAGVTLNSSTGALATTDFGGSSTTPTTYTFTVRITDVEGQTTTREFSLTSSFGATGGGQFN